MYILFEEDGAFKTGNVLADNDASLQVETSTGKRVKLKSANVLLRFNSPAAGELIPAAEAEAQDIDAEFLWEMCGDEEFAFADFAAEYFGHPASPVEASAVLLALFGAPIYFHRKGRGRFRKAPPEILQAALAGAEKKRLQQEQITRMKDELVAGTLPAEFGAILQQLLYRPDRNRLETKALEAAAEESGCSEARLLLKVGALKSTHDLHLGRFLFEYFPEGTGFPPLSAPSLPELPTAAVRAFSIDDATTTEIDDAFSLTPRQEGGWSLGIHIAAPGLVIRPGDDIDNVARKRLSTVYMPGNKLTMLPDDVVSAYTLGEGEAHAALSLYVDINPDYSIASSHSTIECVPVAANLRHHDLEPLFNETSLLDGLPQAPWMEELRVLWEFATVLEAGRGKPSSNQNMLDYNYYVDWEQETRDGPGRISIEQRKRGSPLDKLVAELMILANSTWGRMLHEAGIPAIYRIQAGGKVRMSTASGPHEGLGVDSYAWSSSPLRRYVDLINQWQLIALLREEDPVFSPGSAKLATAMADFDQTYNAYNEFQRGMERYWSLRWLRQEDVRETAGRVLRENIVRLEPVPFVFKLHSQPAEVGPNDRVAIGIERIDLVDIDLRAKYLSTLPPPATKDEGTGGEEEPAPVA